MKNSVAVIIPAFNGVNYLKESIESCLDQKFLNEIIVCNHGGDEKIDKIVSKYKSRIKYIKSNTNLGPEFCWFTGLINSNSEYVHFHFDDDIMHREFLNESIKLFRDDVGFVFSNTQIVDCKNRIIKSRLFNLNLKTGIHNVAKFHNFSLNKLVSPGCIVFRRKDLINNLHPFPLGYVNENYHGVGIDLLMTLNISLNYAKFGYINEQLYSFRHHEKSITSSSMNNIDSFIKLQNTYVEYRKIFVLNKIYKNRLINFLINFLLLNKKTLLLIGLKINIPFLKKIIKKHIKD